MAALTSAVPKSNSCISLRAASISASDTRPSDLATYPMTSKVVRKNSLEIDVDPLGDATRPPALGSSMYPMMAPTAAPQALLVMSRPSNAPKKNPVPTHSR